MQMFQDVICHGIALNIAGRTHVQAELTTARHYIDRTMRHMQHANGGNGITILSRALFHINRPFCESGHGIVPLIHGTGSRMACSTFDVDQIAHTAIDRSDHT